MLSLISSLKNVGPIRRPVKQAKVYREFFFDATIMARYLLDGGSSLGHTEYRILLAVHSLEKGLSHRNPRRFGVEKAVRLVGLLDAADGALRETSAYTMGISVLRAWLCFNRELGGGTDDGIKAVASFLATEGSIHEEGASSGSKSVADDHDDSWPEFFESFSRSRFSRRHYSSDIVSDRTIESCVAIAQLSPSACNRQMVYFRVFDDAHHKRVLFDTLHGTGGIDYESCRLGLVTYDSRSLEFYGERNQGYFNAGLFSMGLVLAFHSHGVGSCLLQFGNSFREERSLARALSLAPYERIAVGLSFGYSEARDTVPVSARRRTREVYHLDVR